MFLAFCVNAKIRHMIFLRHKIFIPGKNKRYIHHMSIFVTSMNIDIQNNGDNSLYYYWQGRNLSIGCFQIRSREVSGHRGQQQQGEGRRRREPAATIKGQSIEEGRVASKSPH